MSYVSSVKGPLAAGSTSAATSSCSGRPGGQDPPRHRLGVAATEAGYRTYFTSALRTYTGSTVPVIDELGYLPLDQASANWIFQVVSRRYEKSSPIVLTSNRGCSDWGQVFADQVVASAIVDRLIHNAVVVNIRGRSYRMRANQEAPPTLAPAAGDGRRQGGD